MFNKSYSLIVINLVVALLVVAAVITYKQYKQSTIKVGVLHSLSGNMAISEKGMVDATLLAIEKINQEGGLLGKRVQAVVRDGQSDPEVFAQTAERLIKEDEVDVIFGCWTSSCRKSLLPVIERNKHLLYYSLQYEGMEASPNAVYLGVVPNQQIVPALEWSFSHYGKKVYLVGSDYVYPRATNEVVKDKVEKWRGKIVGEYYKPLGSADFSEAIAEINRTKPDVIFNTINGESNLAFFRALRESGVSPDSIPTFSFSISEQELINFEDIDMAGDFVVSNYLQNLENERNIEFVQNFKTRYGEERVIGNSMQVAYVGVYLWAKAVEKIGSSETEKVRQAAGDISIRGPAGMVYIEDKTKHTWKSMHIAKITEDGQLHSVWFSKIPIAPDPFPETRNEAQWAQYLKDLQQSWEGHWQAAPDS